MARVSSDHDDLARELPVPRYIASWVDDTHQTPCVSAASRKAEALFFAPR